MLYWFYLLMIGTDNLRLASLPSDENEPLDGLDDSETDASLFLGGVS